MRVTPQGGVEQKGGPETSASRGSPWTHHCCQVPTNKKHIQT